MCFKSKQAKVSESKLPKWLDSASQDLVSSARTLTERPYAPYPYARIAPFSGDQQLSFDLLRNFAPAAMPDAGASSDLIEQGATAPAMQYQMPRLIDDIPGMGPAAGSIGDYMNTFTSPVLDRTVREMGRQNEIGRNRLDAEATMAGAFGDARHGVVESEMDRNFNQNLSDTVNNIMMQAYDRAMGLRESDLNRGLNTFSTNVGSYEGALDRLMRGGAGVAGTQGQDIDNLLRYVGALSEAGGQQQDLAQRSADLGYTDYLRQFGYPEALVEMLTGVAGSVPHGTQQYGRQPSTGASILSAAAPLAALAFSDRRLKRDIVRLGAGIHGLGVYLFRYVWGGAPCIGFMADEVRRACPDAVVSVGGFHAVDYAKVI